MAAMDGKPTTFITLTLSGKGEPLTELIDRLYKHFRALRQHPVWSGAVQGGAAFLEVKYSDKARRWHPHLHIICHAKFVQQSELSLAWRSITKDSFIVDIRRVKDVGHAAKYVTKYASKPLNTSFAMSPILLDEAVVALKGRRLCLCFGTWYGTPLDLAEDTEFADDLIDLAGWHNVGSLEETLELARQGETASVARLLKLGIYDRFIATLAIPPPD